MPRGGITDMDEKLFFTIIQRILLKRVMQTDTFITQEETVILSMLTYNSPNLLAQD